MQERAKIFGIFLIILLITISVTRIIHADIDWTMIKEIKIGAQPLDVATSPDGTLIFILAPGEILVHSVSKNKVTNRIPIPKDFDRVAYTAKNNTLILTSSSLKTLKIIQVDRIYEIDISSLPFEGPEDAPITIAVFGDYQ